MGADVSWEPPDVLAFRVLGELEGQVREWASELAAIHAPDSDQHFCVTCGAQDGSWPCASSLVADEMTREVAR